MHLLQQLVAQLGELQVNVVGGQWHWLQLADILNVRDAFVSSFSTLGFSSQY